MIRIRLMTTADLPAAMRLKSEAGWNQVEADWRRFLAMQPDGCFVAQLDGAPIVNPIGTTVTCIFGHVAWVAMVLVDAAVRGRGIGTALMEHALAFLDRQGVRSVRLDATPLGQPLYEKLGFVAEYALARYAGAPGPSAGQAGGDQALDVRTPRPGELDRLIKLDRDVTGTDRRKFLTRLFAERSARHLARSPAAVRVFERGGDIAGYLASRAGADAVQLGPCVGTPDACARLVRDAAVRHDGQRVFLDVPVRNVPAVRLADELRLVVQRNLVRMCRGAAVAEDRARLWASSGPELG